MIRRSAHIIGLIGLFLFLAGEINAKAPPAAQTFYPSYLLNNGFDSESTVEEEPYRTEYFTLDGSGSLKVYTVSGNVEVFGSEGSDVVRVELYVKRGYALWSSEKSLDNYLVHIDKKGSEIMAVVEPKSRAGGFWKSDDMTFSFKIYVPNRISSVVKTQGGNVTLSGLSGSQKIKTGGGNLTLLDIQGELQAYTTGGDISMKSLKGAIQTQTNGGNIDLDDCEGEMRLITKAGNIKGDKIAGSFLAKTYSGDIRTNFLTMGDGVKLEAIRGDIRAVVPENSHLDLVLKGSDVDLYNVPSFRGERESNRVVGRINEGGTTINMITNTGDVVLEFF